LRRATAPAPSAGDGEAPTALPDFLVREPESAWHGLNPLTKAVVATVIAVAAVALGGFAWPLALTVVGVLVPALVARVLPRLVRVSLIATLPLAVSGFLINLFFLPGASEILVRIGPLAASAEGLQLGLEIVARVAAISGAITLFYLTTPPYELVADLERRGVSPRLAFVANASAQAVPAMVERAAAILAAQRARGLDTEGSPIRRVAALVPIVGPIILGTLTEVEERTLALEARAFSRPGARTLLWWPSDSAVQRAVRWGLVLALVAVVVGRSVLGL
jgi:energy-coupling factor transport system permease protein